MSQDINFTPIFEYIDAKNDELLEKMQGIFATKEDIRNINGRLDELVVIVRKLDEERLFTIEWIRRIEGEVEKIKKHLQIA
jgi:DNA-dependent RNA polymerase auxiliary subunit epsilon